MIFDMFESFKVPCLRIFRLVQNSISISVADCLDG